MCCALAANCCAKPEFLDPAPRLPEESINVTWVEDKGLEVDSESINFQNDHPGLDSQPG